MKVCPKCNESYTDEYLNFCLADGELLLEAETQDAPPTIMMNSARVTNDGNWGSGYDPSSQQSNNPFQNDPFNSPNQQIYQPPSNAMAMSSSQDKSLATISLALGAAGFLLLCCYLGVPFGAAGLITGFIAISKINKDPQAYAGKELAVIGMVLGGLSIVLSMIWIILVILGNIA
ncbi:MAG: DUF4190 domain-containing protein [Pyrinomonadaceae bacterium]